MIRVILALFLVACSSQQRKAQEVLTDPSMYRVLIRSQTRSDRQYNGLYNTFEVSATILNSRVVHENLNQLGHYMQWDAKKLQEKRKEKLQELSTYSTFLVLLYTPEKGHNDLTEEEKSIWKVYLDHKGSRYRGRAEKSLEKFVQLKKLFPHITRFHKPYIVTFDIPMSTIEKNPSQLTLTSSLGSTTLKYKGL